MEITIVVAAIVLFMVIKTMNESKKRKQESAIDADIQINEDMAKDSSSKLSLFSSKGRLKRGTYFWIYACVSVSANLLDLFLENIFAYTKQCLERHLSITSRHYT